MRIASFDVGIKNLALCVLETTDDGDDVRIVHWEVINLIDQPVCDDAGCKLSAMYQDAGKRRYCAVHKTLALASKPNGLKLQKVKPPNCNKMDITLLKMNIIRELDARRAQFDVDEVVIENQPTLKNPRMKGVSDTMYAWFLIRMVVDAQRVRKVCFISPSNKLKKFCVQGLLEDLNDAEKYKTTKGLSVAYTKQWLGQQPERSEWVEHLGRHAKQDDLCDSFLQGKYYLTHNRG